MTNTAKKAVSFEWNATSEKALKELYTGDNSQLKAIAEKLGAKSAQSVRAKLASLKLYVKSETATQSKKASTKLTKVEKVQNLESLLNLDRDALDSLEKANASALDLLAEKLVEIAKADQQSELESEQQSELESE